MALGIATAVRNAMLAEIAAAVDAGAGPGKVRIYDGARPATGGAATNLLAELTMSDPSGTASGGVLTMNAITADSSADASGDATWFRLVDSNNTFVLDGSVSATGGGGDMQMPTITIAAGQEVSISSFTITDPNG